jgi:hypothetical protein
MASCIESLLSPENDSDACRRRRTVAARYLVRALSAMISTPTAINNLARALGGK